MENDDANIVQQRGIFDQFSQARDGAQDSKKGAIEYFLTKLKRVDAEMATSRAELRELNEEISRKEFKIEKLKIRLENLMRGEINREINRLEQMKRELKYNVKKADRVLAGLGLIWVGENAATNSDQGVRSIASPEGSFYRSDPGYHEITNDPTTVAPFSGHGYRLGTGSEIFEQGTNESKVVTPERIQASNSHQSRYSGSAISAGPSSTVSRQFELSVNSSDHRIRQANVKGPTKIKSLEELPLEFRLMSKSEKRRALKQVSVQIQKNMNKYAI